MKMAPIHRVTRAITIPCNAPPAIVPIPGTVLSSEPTVAVTAGTVIAAAEIAPWGRRIHLQEVRRERQHFLYHGRILVIVGVGHAIDVVALADKELWAIAVERPADDSREIQSVVRVTDAAMATSGDYRNFFEYDGQRYSHTIDPRTGRPVAHNVAAVTVVGASAASADALATALLVLGPEDGPAFAAREDIAAYFLLRTDSGIEQRMTDSFAALVNL